MEKEIFEKYVEERYKGQMDYYKNASARNQKRYQQFQWVLIILSALTPVFAALRVGKIGAPGLTSAVDLNVVVLIISSIVAILTTGLKTFNYQELWVNARATYEKLKPEIHYYNFNIGPYGVTGVDKESVFVTRVEEMLTNEHNQWPPAKTMKDVSEKNGDTDNEQKTQ
ncbi:DUF4231 domain-containing protein [Pedobacter sp. HMF7647]|uniref:DUF4231 domain-containing protein n=1 Tax=Hufsiella arboris TaxID=2695275 RepID=A0A7K1YEY3_9SPHI|nr:DUF4231 domain-containing protein [Hufsiella arboris]MXV53166.1 DUF4231 domain-containing protein [Hufsiella arboris]